MIYDSKIYAPARRGDKLVLIKLQQDVAYVSFTTIKQNDFLYALDCVERATNLNNVLTDKSRKMINVIAKQLLIFWLNLQGATSLAIAKILKLHHSTILYHIKQHHNRTKHDTVYQYFYTIFVNLLNQHNRE